MNWINENTIILGLIALERIILIYIGYRIIKHLIKYGINYFYERKSGEQIAIYDESNEYHKIELTREELDEISIALKARIDDISQKIEEAHTPEAKEVLAKILQDCITAQKQTTYAGQPEKYQYREGR